MTAAIVFIVARIGESCSEQVERFKIGGEKKGQENGALDALAMLAGFR